MMRLLFLLAPTLLLAAPLDFARAAEPEKAGFFYDAQLRLRYEAVDWFGADTVDTDYAFPHKKLQIGGGYQGSTVKLYVQGQYFQLWELPENGAGTGASYFAANDGDSDPGGLSIRQGYLQLRADKLTGQVGRFLYSSGNETLHPDAEVTWLKNRRIGQRLIGAFDFTGGRSFDGARIDLDAGGGQVLTSHYSQPTQGGFETNIMGELGDVDLATAAYTRAGTRSEGQLFYYYFRDDRGLVKTDNRPSDVRAAELDEIDLHTIGGHWVATAAVGNGIADLLLWGLVQLGDWGDQDHLAGAAALEGGYRFASVQGKPWLRAGYNYGSGDDDPADDDHSTLSQLLPTGRIYAQTPFYNMQNTHDLFFQALWSPLSELTLRTDAHVLFLVEDEDLLYFGSGANEQRSRFGFSGVPSGDESYVGTLVDLELTWQLHQTAALTFYYGHVFGGDALEQFTDEDIDYAFIELNLKLPG